MLSTPNTAPVGSPRELVKGGSAWNARYRYEEPSTRTRSGRWVIGWLSSFLGRGCAVLLLFVGVRDGRRDFGRGRRRSIGRIRGGRRVRRARRGAVAAGRLRRPRHHLALRVVGQVERTLLSARGQ